MKYIYMYKIKDKGEKIQQLTYGVTEVYQVSWISADDIFNELQTNMQRL